mmetsp:Transcript_7958/g.11201  ORF Transcript_7958/g.11201 Transcript_7958/m.11201 type:complete len:87 (-) Transcript_7958:1903-2163(-)
MKSPHLKQNISALGPHVMPNEMLDKVPKKIREEIDRGYKRKRALHISCHADPKNIFFDKINQASLILFVKPKNITKTTSNQTFSFP